MRRRRFGLTGFGRRGLDPAEVGEFLEQVALDMEALYAELARSRDQNIRIKTALKRWQSQQAATIQETSGR